jgi:hypothetical protein
VKNPSLFSDDALVESSVPSVNTESLMILES